MNKNNKISVIIPCHPPDLKDLPQALSSLNQSTLLPNEVIVALSETDKKEGLKLTRKFQASCKFPITFATTLKKQYAGQNRNRGARIARYDILVFFDADDLCHPQKLEITKYIFDKYQPKLFLHQYSSGVCPWQKYNPKKLRLVFSKQIYNLTFGRPPKRQQAIYIYTDRKPTQKKPYVLLPAHGHATVAKSVFKKIKYSNLPRAQDVVFCLDVLWQFKSCIYADANLICYLR